MRPVLAGVALLTEILDKMSIDDLADLNEALDVKEEAEAYYSKQAKGRKKNGPKH